MERQPYPPHGSCVAKNSQRPASVEIVQGGVPPYGLKEGVLADVTVSGGVCAVCVACVAFVDVTVTRRGLLGRNRSGWQLS